MMFVYVVSWHLDCDSTVVAVFDTEEKADKYCSDRNSHLLCLQSYSYEEFEVQ